MSKKDKIKKNDSGSGVDLKDKSANKNKMQPPKKYKCVMHNDDYTPMDFVVSILQVVFHKSSAASTRLMLDVHNKNKGVAGIYTKEIAETKSLKCKMLAIDACYPFLVTVEPE